VPETSVRVLNTTPQLRATKVGRGREALAANAHNTSDVSGYGQLPSYVIFHRLLCTQGIGIIFHSEVGALVVSVIALLVVVLVVLFLAPGAGSGSRGNKTTGINWIR
jgi:hypothetical protein